MYHQIMNIHYDEKTLHAMNTAYFNNIYIFKKEENDLYCLYQTKKNVYLLLYIPYFLWIQFANILNLQLVLGKTK